MLVVREKMHTLLIINAISLVCMQIEANVQKFSIIRSNIFEDHRPRIALVDFEAQKVTKTSLSECGHLCTVKSNCLSFNYCSSRTCVLNNQDAFSSSTAIFEPNNVCSYFGMKRNQLPSCSVGGVERNITDDSFPDSCGINLKRVDSFLAPPGEVIQVSNVSDEWTITAERLVLLSDVL